MLRSFANFTVIVAGLPSFAGANSTPMLLSVNPDVAPPWIANVSPKPTSAASGLSPTFVSAVNTRPLLTRSATSFN